MDRSAGHNRAPHRSPHRPSGYVSVCAHNFLNFYTAEAPQPCTGLLFCVVRALLLVHSLPHLVFAAPFRLRTPPSRANALAGQTLKDDATIDMLFELSKDIAGKKDLVHEGPASDTVRQQKVLYSFEFI
jgi:hypothetical protein